jgi:sensor histidine kinase YesM
LRLKKKFIVSWLLIGGLFSLSLFLPFIDLNVLFSCFAIFSLISVFAQFKFQQKLFKETHESRLWENIPLNQIKSELLYSFLIGTFQWAFLFIIGKFVSPKSLDPTHYNIYILIIGFSQPFFLNFLYHLLYLMQQNKYFKKEAIRVEQLSSIIQKKTLQDLVSPHFLFNSLNTVASIAADDTEQAVEFVRKLSDLYTFILKNNENKLIELKEEIEIVEKYGYLIQTRFGAYFQIKINISKEYNNALIPPLALQNLVENASKHNVVTRKKPLKLTIEVVKGFIVVTNNINPKKIFKNESTNLGLNYIKTQIEQFSNQEIRIEKTEDFFKVEIPIIYP